MFFILSKVLYFLILPFSWLFIALVGSFLIKYPKRSRQLRMLSVLLLILFSNGFLSNKALRSLESEPVNLDQSYDLGIVLTGMVRSGVDVPNQIHLSEASDRLIEAVRLYKQGIIKRILISGGASDINNLDENEGMTLAILAVDLGVKNEDLIIESQSRNTHENALYSKPLVGQFRSSLLITSAFHMKRAELCFKMQGVNFQTYPVDFLTHSGSSINQFVPSIDAFKQWHILTKELVGLVMYKLMGYI